MLGRVLLELREEDVWMDGWLMIGRSVGRPVGKGGGEDGERMET